MVHEFSLDFEAEEITLTSTKPGSKMSKWAGKYEIRDLSGANREKYLKEIAQRYTMRNGKPVRLKDPEGMMADLLCKSMYRMPDNEGEEERQVTKEFLQSIPGTKVEQLFKIAAEMSGLNADLANEEARQILAKMEGWDEKFQTAVERDDTEEIEGLKKDYEDFISGLREILTPSDAPEEVAKNA